MVRKQFEWLGIQANYSTGLSGLMKVLPVHVYSWF
jgi:hypothetical protein